MQSLYLPWGRWEWILCAPVPETQGVEGGGIGRCGPVVLLGLLEIRYRHQGRLLEVCTEKSDSCEFYTKTLDWIITLEGCVDFEISIQQVQLKYFDRSEKRSTYFYCFVIFTGSGLALLSYGIETTVSSVTSQFQLQISNVATLGNPPSSPDIVFESSLVTASN